MAENEERSDEFHHYDVSVSSSENSRLCPNDDNSESVRLRLVRRSDFVYQLLTKIDHRPPTLTVTLWATTNELARAATQAEQRHTRTDTPLHTN